MRTFIEWLAILMGGLTLFGGACFWWSLIFDTSRLVQLLDRLTWLMGQIQWT